MRDRTGVLLDEIAAGRVVESHDRALVRKVDRDTRVVDQLDAVGVDRQVEIAGVAHGHRHLSRRLADRGVVGACCPAVDVDLQKSQGK